MEMLMYREGDPGGEGGIAVLPREDEDSREEIDEPSQEVDPDSEIEQEDESPFDEQLPILVDMDELESNTVKLEHEVAGVPFRLEKEEGCFFLSHPRWSLVGVGESLLEAEQSLVENARIKADLYLSHPVTQMTRDAYEMREFIITLLSHGYDS